jgi:hypothetical protein
MYRDAEQRSMAEYKHKQEVEEHACVAPFFGARGAR